MSTVPCDKDSNGKGGRRAAWKIRQRRQKLPEDLRISFRKEVTLKLEYGESTFR